MVRGEFLPPCYTRLDRRKRKCSSWDDKHANHAVAAAIACGGRVHKHCAEELAPWKSNRHPTDVPRRHVQEKCGRARVEIRVVQGGTMDGRNCRSPQGVWTPFEQTWESNRSVRMENVGETDVVNPWLSNGRNDFRSISAIVARAIEPGMTDKEKAMALWWQQIQHRFHYQGDNQRAARVP